MVTRRQMLKRSSLLALAPTIPTFLARAACSRQRPNHDDGRILVVLQLDGGNDGINTVVPFADEAYDRHRQALRLPTNRLLKIADDVGLHPAMRAAAELFDDERLSVVQAVGYPNPNRSHFRSMAIWHTARFQPDEHVNFGWAGMALDQTEPSGGANAILAGPEKVPLALRGRRSVAASLLHAEDLALASWIRPAAMSAEQNGDSDLSSFVERTVLDAYATADEIAASIGKDEGTGGYPATPLAERLKLIGQLIKSQLPTRVYYAIQSGYDTHAVQLPGHARLLREFADGTKALLDDLASAGLADRVVILAFSEFGRRVEENGSHGTDHGTAGPVFLAGPAVKAGIVGRTPSLSNLQDGDLRMQYDFRQVYATVLETWLGIDSKSALGGRFELMPLFA